MAAKCTASSAAHWYTAFFQWSACCGPFFFGSMPDMETYLEFAGNHVLLVSALVFSFFVLVFMELRRKAAGITSLDPHEVVRLINADAVIIDLRSADAFARGHIVNAKNIPQDELATSQDKIDRLKSKPIIAVCDSGISSTRAVAALSKSGVESVYDLRGGIKAWTQANMPLVSSKKTKSKG